MSEANLIQIIIQGGGIGISVFLILYMWRKDKLYNKTIQNHFVHNEAAFEKVAESNIRVAEALTELSIRMQGCRFNKLNKK